MSKPRLLIAVFVIAALVGFAVMFLRSAQQGPAIVRADGIAAAPPSEPDTMLAKVSTDPVFVNFVSGFRTSSSDACKASLTKTLQARNSPAVDKVDGICSCATERVIDTLALGEARAATAGAQAGNPTANPTVQALTARFADFGKRCMSEAMAH